MVFLLTALLASPVCDITSMCVSCRLATYKQAGIKARCKYKLVWAIRVRWRIHEMLASLTHYSEKWVYPTSYTSLPGMRLSLANNWEVMILTLCALLSVQDFQQWNHLSLFGFQHHIIYIVALEPTVIMAICLWLPRAYAIYYDLPILQHDKLIIVSSCSTHWRFSLHFWP